MNHGHRCVIPMGGFYEWTANGSAKTPFYFHMADGNPLAVAGLWSEHPTLGLNATVITVEAAGFVTDYHQRMPAILSATHIEPWLSPATPPTAAQALLRPYPGNSLTVHEVSREVSPTRAASRVDDPRLIEPVESLL